MGGGLLQLVADGDNDQDLYLTGNPQITFFKVVYRRHTNFSIESIQQVWLDGNNTELNGRASCIIDKNADLLYKLYLVMKLKCTSIKSDESITIIYNPSHTIIKSIECIIGGTLIDRQSGSWMEIYSQLTELNSAGYVGNLSERKGTKFQTMSKSGGTYFCNQTNEDKHTITIDAYVPLRFWFCKHTGLSLPLIALQYHDVTINLEINEKALYNENNINNTDNGSIEILENNLFADYIFLDKEERIRFSQSEHEYLIEQIQYREFDNGRSFLNLNYINHPVKEIIWTAGINQKNGYFNILPGANYSLNNNLDPYKYIETNISYQLLLNNNERFCPRPLEYFTKQQIYDYHTGTPVYKPPFTILSKTCDNSGNSNQNIIAVYSFALKPEDHQPTGTCNFTRIDNCTLSIINGDTLDENYEYNVFSVNYNILRLKNGMCGILYSN